MRIFGWIEAITALGLLVVATGARADEEKIPLDDVPRAVIDAVKVKFPDAKIKKAVKEEEDGTTVYELSFTHEDKDYKVEAKADGTIIAVEREIAVSDLPEAVVKGVKAKYPDAKIEKAEEVTEGLNLKVTYEIEIETAEKKELEITLDASGSILKTEEEDDNWMRR